MSLWFGQSGLCFKPNAEKRIDLRLIKYTSSSPSKHTITSMRFWNPSLNNRCATQHDLASGGYPHAAKQAGSIIILGCRMSYDKEWKSIDFFLLHLVARLLDTLLLYPMRLVELALLGSGFLNQHRHERNRWHSTPRWSIVFARLYSHWSLILASFLHGFGGDICPEPG